MYRPAISVAHRRSASAASRRRTTEAHAVPGQQDQVRAQKQLDEQQDHRGAVQLQSPDLSRLSARGPGEHRGRTSGVLMPDERPKFIGDSRIRRIISNRDRFAGILFEVEQVHL